MAVYPVADKIEIHSEDPVVQAISIMQYLVGFGLTRWHFVEQDLTMVYLMLSVPKDAPVDAALATFSCIETVDAKINLLLKVLNQVLYQDELTDFRKQAKKSLVRIKIINEKRNKIAHGMAKAMVEGDPNSVRFLPYYNIPSHYREDSYRAIGAYTSIIKPQEKWDVAMLTEVVDGFKEGVTLSSALYDDLNQLYEERQSIIAGAARMYLDQGLPYDPTLPSNDQLEESDPI